MTREEVLTRLCYYDKRNPFYNGELEEIDSIEYEGTRCFCDNCFYRRTEMAEYILKLLGE